ncbi:MAG: porin [Vicinamibacterales bacterium]
MLALGVWLALGGRADASNEALLKLLQLLRDRGSITAAEYEEIRVVADAETQESGAVATPTPAPSSSPAPAPAPTLAFAAAPASGPGPAPAAPPAPPVLSQDIVKPLVDKAVAGKWYEKLGLRGYTQFRYEDALNYRGAPIEVPTDRAVNKNESFMIRRGRFVFSGDAAEHLNLYAQIDYQASTGASDFSVQARDLYADISLDKAKTWRVRLGQSKVPFGFVNMQSSSNRAPLERPDALNSAIEGERDLGASLLWASTTARTRFRELGNAGLKGSGDYGVVAVGAYSGQGLNRPDQNGHPHVFGRVQYPFKTKSGQYFEVGAQGYHGRFVAPTQSITTNGVSFVPTQRTDGELDQRVAGTFVWYPQPIGIETEWTVGRGPSLDLDRRSIGVDSLWGGYVQLNYRHQTGFATWFPFTRWHYFDGARKFGRNAPHTKVNEVDFGLEFLKWTEVEVTGMFTHTFTRTQTSTFPYNQSTAGNRIGVQVQWNY